MAAEKKGTTGSAKELVQSANRLEIGYGEVLYKGLSLADLAHIVMLTEAGIIPAGDGGTLLRALLAMHEIPAEKFVFDPSVGDAYKNRERTVQQLAPEAGGWLRTGRARREATNVAYQIAVRERLLAFIRALLDLACALTDLAERHTATIMSDYTYLQHAQPTTFAHYLLGFVFPLTRDFDRLGACYRRVNRCSGGIGSVNGSRLPFRRERLAELLGFDGAIHHARDAMWQADMPVEIMAAAVAALISVDRLGEDLQIFFTHEFDLVDLDDGFCRESVIMPQKKNPYGLAYIRGATGTLIGHMTAMANVGRTITGQPDNRIFAYGDIPKALDTAVQVALLMAGTIRTLTVNADTMAQRVLGGHSQATDLAELVMQEAHLPYQTAHRIIGDVIVTAARNGVPARLITPAMIDDAARRLLGRPLAIPADVLARELEPAAIVATRIGLGGASASSTARMIAEVRQAIEETNRWHMDAGTRLQESETQLLSLARTLAGAQSSNSPS